MIVAQNRPAYNRQIGVGAEEIVREERDEIQQFAESRAVDFHWRVLAVKRDAVFVIIDIRRVLKVPLRMVDRDRNDTVILPRGGIQMSSIAFILAAERAFRIRAFLALRAAAIAFGSFSGLERLTVMSKSPNSLG